MRCETIMKDDVLYVLPTESAQRAAIIMRAENVGFLPVCDEGGCVLGTLTDRDLAMRVCTVGVAASAVSVGAVMTRDLVACRPEDDLTVAERLMAEHGKSRILITDGATRLLGIVSLSDVVKRDSNKHAAHTLRKIVEREYRY
ncbi:MAG TPA: CBS domain-containing protein [Polyangia bacterium]